MRSPALSLDKLQQEDPTFRVHTDHETGQTLISGMGESSRDHHRPLASRVQGWRRDQAATVAYREAISAGWGRGRYVKQTGGRGQCELFPDPFRPTEASEFVFNWPSRERLDPARDSLSPVSRALPRAMETGPLAGYPMMGIGTDL
ncbi:MAG: hypothetical protein R2991_05470 [Thermoanaerobaculia bacterium]